MADKTTNGRGDIALPPMMMPFGFEAIMELNRPALQAMAQMNGKMYDGIATLNKNWVAFLNRRLKEDLAVPQQLAACKTVQDMYGVYAGFFQNVGRTRRQGIELTAAQKFGPFGVVARYGFIDATYRTGFIEHSPANSTADANGDIEVQPGNRIPGLPRQTLRLRLDFEPTTTWSVGANVIVNSSIWSRGDENNQDASGPVPGYTVVNLDGRVRVTKNVELFARINNLFDREYSNFGVLGENVFTGPGRSFDPANGVNESFRGLGAPRGAWVGVRFELD